MEWYYAKHGKQEGPVDAATLQGKVQSGEVAPTDLVWKEGMAEWRPAGEVPELAVPSAPGMEVSPSGGAAPTPGPVVRQPAPVAHVPVPNYLVPAILVTVLCCVPLFLRRKWTVSWPAVTSLVRSMRLNRPRCGVGSPAFWDLWV